MAEPAKVTCPCATAEPRRTFLQGAAGLVMAWLAPARVAAGAQDAARARPESGDVLVRVGDTSSTPLGAADILVSSKPVVVWPMAAATRTVRSGSRLNRVVVVRLDPAQLSDATRARSADGIVAFSAVCTHTGCEVGDFLGDELQLYCECHQSKFDPRDGAKVTDGPAPRPLPALPLGIDTEGRLVVAAPFTSRPGFEQG